MNRSCELAWLLEGRASNERRTGGGLNNAETGAGGGQRQLLWFDLGEIDQSERSVS